MHNSIHDDMREATRLTRAGRLQEATARIQQMLRGTPIADTPTAATPSATVIEGRFRVPDHHSCPQIVSPVSAMPVSNATDRSADRGQFLTQSYTNQAGTRSYKLYVPSGYHGQTLPLVVMLHGCTQNPDDFAAGTRMNSVAEEQGYFVAYPAQLVRANSSNCWNWFKAADQQRDRGEPSLIAGITRQICETYQIDLRRVYVAGLSAGGAMALIMGRTYPDLYAAIGVHSGLAYGAAHDLPSALGAMQRGASGAIHHSYAAAPSQVVPTIVFHGDSDTTVHQRNADQVVAQWATISSAGEHHNGAATKLKARTERGQAAAGHTYTRTIYRDADDHVLIEQWLVHGAGHAWSGGSRSGSFTDPNGPDATREMLRFFAAHTQREQSA